MTGPPLDGLVLSIANGFSKFPSETIFVVVLISYIMFLTLGYRFAKPDRFGLWLAFVIPTSFFVIISFGIHCLLLFYGLETKGLSLF